MFNKRHYKELVENLGGVVAEEISELQELSEGGKGNYMFLLDVISIFFIVLAFLVADTHYRTHKYLFALAASIPCIHFSWLKECDEKVC